MAENCSASRLLISPIRCFNNMADFSSLDFRNPTLPLSERVADLAARLTIDEKAALLLHDAPGIERLGIKPYAWWNECLHGVARNGRATVFPQAIALAATFDTDLVYRVATAISDEARAKHEMALERGYHGRYSGLTFWSPNINIFRDPRWGRGQETYGEDPWLTSRMGVAFVRGLQGDDPKHLKLAACAKHFAVHSGPEALRHSFNAIASARDLHETYLPAFKALVREAGVEIVMGAYNRTNGSPCCAHPVLMGEILRAEWGFLGHFVSDCWALRDFHEHHMVTSTPAESAAMAVKAGCDVNCGCTYKHIREALDQGLLEVADVDACFVRAMSTRFRLGEFDPRKTVRWRALPRSVIGSESHVALAREAAARSFVLLKNNGILPLDGLELSKVYVTGSHAANLDVLMGNYHGISPRLVSFLEGIAARVPDGVNIEYRQGCSSTHANRNDIDWVSYEASQADVAVVCLGVSPLHEGEEGDAIDSPDRGDRLSLGLPAHQIEFVRTLRSREGAKIVLVLTGGSPVTDAGIFELADAVLWVWYPGEQGGNALADILFGDINPSGRLPITFPKSLEDLPPYDDYSMDGRTYRRMLCDSLFPFGFGLGYSRFNYLSIDVEHRTACVTLRNDGARTGREIVQIYTRAIDPAVDAPSWTLAAFAPINLEPGEVRAVDLELSPAAFDLFDSGGHTPSHAGDWEIVAAGSCPTETSRALGASEPVRLTLRAGVPLLNLALASAT